MVFYLGQWDRYVDFKYAFCAKWQYLCDVMHAILKVMRLEIWDQFFEGRTKNVSTCERERKRE